MGYAWGLVALLVMLGFTAMPPLILDVIYIFHYPLLFFMAGYSCGRSSDLRHMWIRRAPVLILFYLMVAAINALVYLTLQSWDVLPGDVTPQGLFWGTILAVVLHNGLIHTESLWVLPVLSVVLVIGLSLERVIRDDLLLVSSLVMALLAWATSLLNVGVLFWSLHALPLALCFFMLGRWMIKRCSLRYSMRPWLASVVMYVFAAVVYLMAALGGRMSPQLGEYGESIGYLVVGGFAGILAAYFRAISVLRFRPLAWIGQRWMPLVGFSYLPVISLSPIWYRLYDQFRIVIWLQPFAAMAQVVISLVLVGGLLWLAERLCPRLTEWYVYVQPECTDQ